jgi:hypothetical protein
MTKAKSRRGRRAGSNVPSSSRAPKHKSHSRYGYTSSRKGRKANHANGNGHPYKLSKEGVVVAQIKDNTVYVKNTHTGENERYTSKTQYNKLRRGNYEVNGTPQAFRKKKAMEVGGLEALIKHGTDSQKASARKQKRDMKKAREAELKEFFGPDWANYKGWINHATLDKINSVDPATIADKIYAFEQANVPYDGDQSITAHEQMWKANNVYAEGMKAPGFMAKFNNLFRMLTQIGPQMAFDITAGKFLVDRNNKKTLAGLEEGDNVLVLLHGFHQNGGAFRRYIKQAEEAGYKVIAPTYDYTLDPRAVSFELQHLTKSIQETTMRRVNLYGHSTGGNNVLNYIGNHPSAKLYTQSAIAASPSTNGLGKPNKTYAHLLFPGGIPDVDSARTRIGRENSLRMNNPSAAGIPHTIMAGQCDALVPAHSAISRYAWQNSIYVETNHFDGAGGHPGVIAENLREFGALDQITTAHLLKDHYGGTTGMTNGFTDMSDQSYQPQRRSDMIRAGDLLPSSPHLGKPYTDRGLNSMRHKPAMHYMQ